MHPFPCFLAVNHAVHLTTHACIQIFEMTQKKRERCLQEVTLLQQLSHPYIIQMYDAFIDDNMLIIIFEWAPAGGWATLPCGCAPPQDVRPPCARIYPCRCDGGIVNLCAMLMLVMFERALACRMCLSTHRHVSLWMGVPSCVHD